MSVVPSPQGAIQAGHENKIVCTERSRERRKIKYPGFLKLNRL